MSSTMFFVASLIIFGVLYLATSWCLWDLSWGSYIVTSVATRLWLLFIFCVSFVLATKLDE